MNKTNENVQVKDLPVKKYATQVLADEKERQRKEEVAEVFHSVNKTLQQVGIQPHNTNNLILPEPTENSVDSYFKQISTNYLVTAKGVYLCCRDLAIAERNLAPIAYEQLERSLVDELQLADGTLSKWLTVGKSKQLLELYLKEKMPHAWTTQYEIAKFARLEGNQDKFKAIEGDITATTTKAAFDALVGIVPKDKEKESEDDKVPNFSFTFESPLEVIKIAFERKNADANIIRFLEKELKKVITQANALAKTTGYILGNDIGDCAVEMSVRTGSIDNLDNKFLSYIAKRNATNKGAITGPVFESIEKNRKSYADFMDVCSGRSNKVDVEKVSA